MLRRIFALRQILAWNFALLALLAIPAGFVARQDEQARKQCEAKCVDLDSSNVTPADHVEDCQKCEANAEWHFPGWYRAFGWPNGVTAWALILTLTVIAAQTRVAAISAEAARISARAAKAQGDHIIVSERAWMVASPQLPDPEIPKAADFSTLMVPMVTTVLIKFVNKGETPGFVKKITTGGCAIPRGEIPELTDMPEWDDVGEIPVVPGQFFSWEHPRITIEKAIKIRTGDLSLWIYGVILYSDSFAKERETGFCFRFSPVGESGPGEWLISGPKGANYAT